MKSTIVLIVFVLCLFCSIFAQSPNNFVIGAYEITNYDGDNSVYLQKLMDAHYSSIQAVNNHHYNDSSWHQNSADPGDNNLSPVAGQLSLDISDMFYPYNSNHLYDVSSSANYPGINFLTSSNYFRFENEYRNYNTEANSGDLNYDWFFYRFDREVGQLDQFSLNESTIVPGFAQHLQLLTMIASGN